MCAQAVSGLSGQDAPFLVAKTRRCALLRQLLTKPLLMLLLLLVAFQDIRIQNGFSRLRS